MVWLDHNQRAYLFKMKKANHAQLKSLLMAASSNSFICMAEKMWCLLVESNGGGGGVGGGARIPQPEIWPCFDDRRSL